MKKILCFVLVLMMIVPLFAVPVNAKGYTLSVPKTVNAHNLNSYGLRTLNVYETTTAPAIDGEVGEGEYPGPDNGMADSVSVKGETNDGYFNHGLWMSSHSAGNMNGYSGQQDFTGYTSERDVPQAVETYLTYDNDYLYFAIVYRHMPEQIAAQVSGRGGSMVFDTRTNFVQSSNAFEAHGSVAWNRYNIAITNAALKNQDNRIASDVYIYNATSSTKSGRQIRQIIDGKDTTNYIEYYVDARGTAWGGTDGKSTVYKRGENNHYGIVVLEDTYTDENGNVRCFWDLTIEGRQPLGDILRISDVEYEDGTPLDYVPEWGVWGSSLRYYSSATVMNVTPNGTEVTIGYDEPIIAQTMLPARGMAYTDLNSRVGTYQFHNTLSNAFATASGVTTDSKISFLMNPVHFLGLYDDGSFDVDYFYGSEVSNTSTVATSSTRATRRKNPNLQEFDGSAARVIGVSSRASSATGDNTLPVIILSVVMVACAAGVVTMLLLNRKKR
ncbi:MAG: hypothetical protein J6Z79_03735, partial [Clostridia bacterium]|nr:hypothetical protein [Clostridia bacterium]